MEAKEGVLVVHNNGRHCKYFSIFLKIHRVYKSLLVPAMAACFGGLFRIFLFGQKPQNPLHRQSNELAKPPAIVFQKKCGAGNLKTRNARKSYKMQDTNYKLGYRGTDP